MPNQSSAIQITTSGRGVNAGNRRITLNDLTGEGEWAGEVDANDRESFHNLDINVPGVYIHVPFCFHKCHYCDFYSIVDSRDRQGEFVDRLIEEMQAVSEFLHQPVQTIFVGGGTPTLLRIDLWRKLLEALGRFVPLASQGEFTVEANPETVTPELLDVLVASGINRISIGAQSFNPEHLRTLERWHDPRNVHRSVEILREAGIENFNLDLIFAIPGQTVEQWLADLDEALSLGPTHLSCYGLTYEANTPMTVRMKAGRIQRVDQEVEAAMYEATIDRLAAAGFEHYEISNWARQDDVGREAARTPSPWKGPRRGWSERRASNHNHTDESGKAKFEDHVGHRPSFDQRALHPHPRPPGGPEGEGVRAAARPMVSRRCQHNLLYWSNCNWCALGPSASGHLDGLRWKNVPRLGEYLDHGPWPTIVDVERAAPSQRIGEQFMLGLRIIEGLAHHIVEDLLQLDDGSPSPSRREAIGRHLSSGLLERTPTHLRLSRRGLLLADTVLADLV